MRMSVLKAQGRIQQRDAEGHRSFLSGAAETAVGFALSVHTCRKLPGLFLGDKHEPGAVEQ